MNITINSTTLSAVLKGACRIAARKTSDITGYLLLDITQARIEVSAHNAKQQLSVTIPSSAYDLVGTGDRYCVSAAKLEQVIASLPRDATVTLQRIDSMVAICSGKTRFNVVTLPAEKFPHAETLGPEMLGQVVMQGSRLSRSLNQIGFCASRDDVRTALNGVSFDFAPGLLTLAATDGQRLGVVENEVASDFDLCFILPSTCIEDVISFCAAGEVEVAFSQKIARFSKSSGVLYTKLVEGAFPDYQKLVLAFSKGNVARVSRDDIAGAVSRVVLLSDVKSAAVRLTVDSTSIAVQSVATSLEDEANDVLPCDFDAEPFEIGFNGSAAVEILKALDTDDIDVYFNGPSSGTLIRDRNSSSHSFVIMPYRL